MIVSSEVLNIGERTYSERMIFMRDEEQERLQFLHEQRDWTRNRMAVLDRLEAKLLLMREIAVYARSDQLTERDRVDLNDQMQSLEREVQALQKQLEQDLH